MQAFMNHLKERAQQDGRARGEGRRRRRGLTPASLRATASRCGGTGRSAACSCTDSPPPRTRCARWARPLAAAGFPVRAVRLAGHGTTPGRPGAHRLARLARVGGGRAGGRCAPRRPAPWSPACSLGALLALLLAARRPRRWPRSSAAARRSGWRDRRLGLLRSLALAAAGRGGATPCCAEGRARHLRPRRACRQPELRRDPAARRCCRSSQLRGVVRRALRAGDAAGAACSTARHDHTAPLVERRAATASSRLPPASSRTSSSAAGTSSPRTSSATWSRGSRRFSDRRRDTLTPCQAACASLAVSASGCRPGGTLHREVQLRDTSAAAASGCARTPRSPCDRSTTTSASRSGP